MYIFLLICIMKIFGIINHPGADEVNPSTHSDGDFSYDRLKHVVDPIEMWEDVMAEETIEIQRIVTYVYRHTRIMKSVEYEVIDLKFDLPVVYKKQRNIRNKGPS